MMAGMLDIAYAMSGSPLIRFLALFAILFGATYVIALALRLKEDFS